jgi:hypothetical protein
VEEGEEQNVISNVDIPCMSHLLSLRSSSYLTFQAKLCASWIPVFMPKPPAGGKVWAASPTRKTFGFEGG